MVQAKDVLQYLKDNPEFLKQHSAQFGLSSSIDHVMALSEKKLSKLYSQHQQLKKHLAQLKENAVANDDIQKRQHQLALALLTAQDMTTLFQHIKNTLDTEFGLPYSVLKLWHKKTEKLSNCYNPSDALIDLLKNKTSFCTHYVSDELLGWLPMQVTFQSFAVLPFLDSEKIVIGLLLIGSEDHERFAPTMQNHYLQMMAEQINMALLHFIG